MTPEIAEAAKAAAAQFPPLTDAQRDRIAAILRAAGDRAGGKAA